MTVRFRLRAPSCRACPLTPSVTAPGDTDHSAKFTLASALTEHVRRELGPIATPSAIEFVAALPKTRSGKILRRFLQAKELGMDAGDVSTMEG
ncbi:MAG TPA: hypothetical protein VEK84_11505 [Terriglobales bacterium]|nr:hypothetical protein [Terriglobales bacterium]